MCACMYVCVCVLLCVFDSVCTYVLCYCLCITHYAYFTMRKHIQAHNNRFFFIMRSYIIPA